MVHSTLDLMLAQGLDRYAHDCLQHRLFVQDMAWEHAWLLAMLLLAGGEDLMFYVCISASSLSPIVRSPVAKVHGRVLS